MSTDRASSQSSNRRAFVAVLVCFLPFVALGPYSFVRMHDNGDSILPSLIILANQVKFWGDSGFWSWFPFQGAGAPSLAQGIFNLYQIPFFAFLPDWLAYQSLVLAHGALAGICLYRLLRDAFDAPPDTAGWFAAGYAVLGYGLGMLVNLPSAWTFPLVYAFWRFSRSHGFFLQAAFSVGIGLTFGVLASSFFLITFHFVTVGILLVVLASSTVRGLILAVLFVSGLLVGNAPELFSLLSIAPISHRVPQSSRAFAAASILFGNAIGVQVVLGILAAMILFVWTGRARSLVIWWIILFAVCFVAPLARPVLPNMFQGLSLERLAEPVRDLSFIVAPLVIRKFHQGTGVPWLTIPSWMSDALRISPVLILGFGIANYYINQSRVFLETGGFTRYHFEVLQRLAKKSENMLGAFRVESLHYPGGSGLLSAYGLESIGGYLNMYSKRYQEFFSRVMLPNDSTVPIPPLVSDYIERSSNHLAVNCYQKIGYALDVIKCADLDLFALANVRYVFSRHTLIHPDLELIEGPPEAWASFDTATKVWRAAKEIFGAPAHIQLYELKTALPRVFVPRSVDVFTDHLGVLDALKRRNAASFRQTAIMSRSDFTEKSDAMTAEPWNGSGEAGKVIASNFSGDAMTVTVDMRREGLVVVTNAYHPAWNARVDGVAAQIYPVFHTFWGVGVPKGRHVVTFRYGQAAL